MFCKFIVIIVIVFRSLSRGSFQSPLHYIGALSLSLSPKWYHNHKIRIHRAMLSRIISDSNDYIVCACLYSLEVIVVEILKYQIDCILLSIGLALAKPDQAPLNGPRAVWCTFAHTPRVLIVIIDCQY